MRSIGTDNMYVCMCVCKFTRTEESTSQRGWRGRTTSAVKGALASAERDMPPAQAHACKPSVREYVCMYMRSLAELMSRVATHSERSGCGSPGTDTEKCLNSNLNDV